MQVGTCWTRPGIRAGQTRRLFSPGDGALWGACPARPRPAGSCARRCVEALGRCRGGRGLGCVALGLPQPGHHTGELGELRDEHHHRGLVLAARRCDESEQPGGGPQPVPRRCRPGDASIAVTGGAGIAVCRLAESRAAQNVGGDMQCVRGCPGRVGGRRGIGEGTRPDHAGGSRSPPGDAGSDPADRDSADRPEGQQQIVRAGLLARDL